MPTPDLCTEEEVTVLTHAFRHRVRHDDDLGPILQRHVQLGVSQADPLPEAR